MNAPATPSLLCYCRTGFEPELAAELTDHAAEAGLSGYARANRDDGFVLFHATEPDAPLSQAMPWRSLVFARQKMRLIADLAELDPSDRVSPVMEALGGQGRFGDLWMEHPDSDAGKPLSGLARAFGNALRPALRKRGFLTDAVDANRPRLHVCLLAGNHLLLGRSDPNDSAGWPQGIPRLRLHADAPSRSALKLEEALLALLTPRERETLLKPGMRAADLGAAPGGWTWVLTRQHMYVSAIDNGPLQPALHDTGLVDHQRADGFRWQPDRTLDWMVCDMVEQPRRVAERMATWFREGWCRHAIFNLKLPMKKRWQEARSSLDLFAEQADGLATLRARQLYHDREEITVFASAPPR
ncbi:23S rRNA (cytidine(2498)-2'-O)-methyltransferase RlmM [Luteimonas abyssi]|uniref:23S rRNA (cytidine(2498)-2'-O)-methyltransferase RlmM n=1 Tax=Luteimonas abyssi TaxID=1247514 RepID=UPI000737C364|nr:23S rRNA (cytidine(2498)-2'-O)-methyltransferase RlmM [Luteimonas abyssi]